MTTKTRLDLDKQVKQLRRQIYRYNRQLVMALDYLAPLLKDTFDGDPVSYRAEWAKKIWRGSAPHLQHMARDFNAIKSLIAEFERSAPRLFTAVNQVEDAKDK